MSIKRILKENPLVDFYLRRNRISEWIKSGYSLPIPHEVKQLMILHYAITHRVDVLVETGTYLGDTIWTNKENFKQIYSIELSKELFERAEKRFRKFRHIHLLQGDSSDQIVGVLRDLNSCALFWLDGHFSGGITARGELQCPIFAELSHIFEKGMHHVILIDDARLFVGKDDYPTLHELSKFVRENSHHEIRIENDVIVLAVSEERSVQ